MTFRKILVGVHHTPAAVHALRAAAQIAAAAGARLVALTVVEDPWKWVQPEEVEGFHRQHPPAPADLAAARAEQDLAQVIATTIGAGQAGALVRFGTADVELARWAALENADLLVLGRQPPGELAVRPAGRALAGTVQRSRVPCLVVPHGQRTWRRVVAAVGTGGAAHDVWEYARAFAGLFDAEPVTVHVEPPARRVAARDAGGIATLQRTTVVYGEDPVGETLQIVRDGAADVLVIGMRHGGSSPAPGRVPALLLERAPCAVLTVPV
jgi:nucleotide-binding universal stress UspA family protein